MTRTSRKALTGFSTGFSGWAAIYLPPWAAGLVGLTAVAFNVWLTPNS